MTETLGALLLGHFLADFTFQTRWMIARKRGAGMAVHIVIVFAATWVALGLAAPGLVLAVTAAHLGIDLLKTYALPDRLWSFVTDQAAHAAVLVVAAAWMPGAFAAGLWAMPPVALDWLIGPATHWIPTAMILAAGFIAATRAGEFAVSKLITGFPTLQHASEQEPSIQNGGATIGTIERALIFTFLMIGEPTAIGFLVAAKSVLRFGAVGEDRDLSELVIIGTLASFAWAIGVSVITSALLPDAALEAIRSLA